MTMTLLRQNRIPKDPQSRPFIDSQPAKYRRAEKNGDWIFSEYCRAEIGIIKAKSKTEEASASSVLPYCVSVCVTAAAKTSPNACAVRTDSSTLLPQVPISAVNTVTGRC